MGGGRDEPEGDVSRARLCGGGGGGIGGMAVLEVESRGQTFLHRWHEHGRLISVHRQLRRGAQSYSVTKRRRDGCTPAEISARVSIREPGVFNKRDDK